MGVLETVVIVGGMVCSMAVTRWVLFKDRPPSRKKWECAKAPHHLWSQWRNTDKNDGLWRYCKQCGWHQYAKKRQLDMQEHPKN